MIDTILLAIYLAGVTAFPVAGRSLNRARAKTWATADHANGVFDNPSARSWRNPNPPVIHPSQTKDRWSDNNRRRRRASHDQFRQARPQAKRAAGHLQSTNVAPSGHRYVRR